MKTLLLVAFAAALVGLIISMVIFYKLLFTKKLKKYYTTF